MSATKHTEAVGVLAKVETTYNTLATFSTSTDGVQVIKPRPDLTIGYAYDGARAAQNGGFGTIQRQTPTGRTLSGTIRCEAKGYGAAYTSSSVTVPHIHPLIRAAGFDATVSTSGGSEKWDFTPTQGTGTLASTSLRFYTRGEQFDAAGGYCNLKITIDGAGIPVWEFPFVSTLATTVADTTLPSITYHSYSTIPPVAAGTSFTWGNFTSGIVRSATFDLGRTIENPRVNINSSAAHAGYQPGLRAPTLDVLVEATTLQGSPYHATTAIDPYQLAANATSGLAFSMTVGSTQYNRWKLIFGQAQLMAPPELVDEGSVGLWRLKLAPYVTTSTGIDDITLRFD